MRGLTTYPLGERPHRDRQRRNRHQQRQPGTIQINERLTWLRGRHTLKFGGSWNYYQSKSHYPGNNGRNGFIAYDDFNFTGAPFADFLLDQVSQKGRGSTTEAWTHLQHRVGLYRGGRLQDHRQPDAEPRPPVGLHVAVRRGGRPAGQLRSDERGASSSPGQNGNSRALYDAVLQRLGAAARVRLPARRALGVPRRLRHRAVHGRHRRQPAAAAQSAVLLRVGGALRRDQRGRHHCHRIRGSAGARPSVGPAARVGSESAAAVHAAVERVRRVPARIAVVDQHRLRRQLVDRARSTPIDGNQPLPGTGDPTHLAAGAAAAAALPVQPGHHVRSARRPRAAARNYNALQSTFKQRLWHGLDFVANYTWSKAMSNNSRLLRQRPASPAEGDSTPHEQLRHRGQLRSGGLRRAAHLLAGRAATSCRSAGSGSSAATGTVRSTRWRAAGRPASRSRRTPAIPITVTRRLEPVAAGVAFDRSGPTGSASGEVENPTLERWIDRAAFVSAPLGQFGDSGVGILRAPGYWNFDMSVSKRFATVRPAVPDVPRRDVQRAQPSELRAAAGEHPEHGLRHDHQHRQRRADRAAGREVLSSDGRMRTAPTRRRKGPSAPCIGSSDKG